MTIQVDIADEQSHRPIDKRLAQRLTEAIRTISRDFGFERGEVSLAILDDAEIRRLNRTFLDHDWAHRRDHVSLRVLGRDFGRGDPRESRERPIGLPGIFPGRRRRTIALCHSRRVASRRNG